MAKYALIVRDIVPPAGRGKIAHALTNATALTDAGHTARIFFEGQGVEWLKLFRTREDKFTQHYRARWDDAHGRGLLGGACNFCSNVRFETSEDAEHWGVGHYGEEGEHGSLVELLADGYEVINF